VGQSVRVNKFGSYYSSRDYDAKELLARSKRHAGQARAGGFDALCAAQEQPTWPISGQQADVQIAGDDALQQGIHFNQFHLLQSVGRDGKTNIAAKGVTGEGYEGHYFWDTEIYIFPFFLYSKPEIARKLLEYRYAGLPKARERARQMSHAKRRAVPVAHHRRRRVLGLLPGRDRAVPHQRRHRLFDQAVHRSDDDQEYMIRHGAEIVMETARIWIGIGSYDREGRFCINQVTGPDEYTALVNNNYYTNAMAQMHLNFAASIAERLQARGAGGVRAHRRARPRWTRTSRPHGAAPRR
jgi:alpha,alpha-trehalose phosphorylase